MSDNSEHNDLPDTYLWILFFSVFIILLAITTYACCYGCFAFMSRYCRRSRCCCCFYVDLRAYRNERDSLHRLRALRGRQNRRHHHRHHNNNTNNYHLPPHYYMGFLLVPTPLDANTAVQEQLTTVQRKRILEQVLDWKHFAQGNIVVGDEPPKIMPDDSDIESQPASKGQQHVELVEMQTADDDVDSSDNNVKNNTQEDEAKASAENDDSVNATAAPLEVPTAASLAFPYHEEPADSCCAICLDDFVVGEVVNSTTRNCNNNSDSDEGGGDATTTTRSDCQHVFHRECLLDWLNRHSICPCCRRSMVSEADWKRGMETEGIRAPQRYQVQMTRSLPASSGQSSPLSQHEQLAIVNMSMGA